MCTSPVWLPKEVARRQGFSEVAWILKGKRTGDASQVTQWFFISMIQLGPNDPWIIIIWRPFFFPRMVLVFCSGDWAFWGPDHWDTGVIPEISNRKPVPVFFLLRKKLVFMGWRSLNFQDAGIVPKESGLGVWRLPSRELTYPPKMAFWRWFSFSHGGIC